MHRVFTILLACLLVTWPMSLPQAARDIQSLPDNKDGLQLIVLEAPGCIYCKIFRRDVAPTYQASKRSKRIPLRFVDLNDVDEAAMGFKGPVTIVPTVILIQKNAEVGRIPGYVGPENFYHSVNYLLGQIFEYDEAEDGAANGS
ncbi:MAG: thioredoxin fold domain-containing protein [Hyphomicrobiaceae bacterium]